MFLTLNHQKLEIYQVSRKLVNECYKITNLLPPEEKYNLVSQMRRAALSVHLNLAEGSSRKSVTERKRYFEISHGSIVEIDTTLEIVVDLGYCKADVLRELGNIILDCFKLLSLLIKKSK